MHLRRPHRLDGPGIFSLLGAEADGGIQIGAKKGKPSGERAGEASCLPFTSTGKGRRVEGLAAQWKKPVRVMAANKGHLKEVHNIMNSEGLSLSYKAKRTLGGAGVTQ